MLAQSPDPEPSQGWTLTTWNDLGMHCMDEDFSIFAILPPFNTLNAELIDKNGDRVSGGNGISVFYQAAADPDGSETKTSAPQTNFWEYAERLFGANLPGDTGLLGNAMPGISNTPQAMHWDATNSWWTAEGIPIIPKNQFGEIQAYPLVRVTARNAAGTLLADTLVTAPVSAEMNCITCHASGTQEAAEPPSGWSEEADPIRDYRLNILKLHDDRHLRNPLYAAALAQARLLSPGSLRHPPRSMPSRLSVRACHASNALGTTGAAGIPPLTQAMHAGHAQRHRPGHRHHPRRLGQQRQLLPVPPWQADQMPARRDGTHLRPPSASRSCPARAATAAWRRSAPPAAPAGSTNPTARAATPAPTPTTPAMLRFTASFLPDGSVREPADDRFATKPDSPAPGVSLFRFSHGHGGLTCSACHGSPHAVYPTCERNDNLQSLDLRGTSEPSATAAPATRTTPPTRAPRTAARTACTASASGGSKSTTTTSRRGTTPATSAPATPATARTARAANSRRRSAPRAFNSEKFGTVTYWQGQRVSCYDCHDGPNESRHFRQNKPVVQSFAIQTATGTSVVATLLGSDADTANLSYRIVDPPQHGTLALSGAQIAYTPDPGFAGTDYFTYCARDDRTDSNLGRVNIEVGADAAAADIDGDGIPDLVERAFGLSVARISRGTAPQIALVESGGEQVLQARYDPRLIPPDLDLIFEVSSDLEVWDEESPALNTSTDTAGNTVKRVTVGSDSRLFMRYRVVRR